MSDDVLALWECPCGRITVKRPRFREGVPEHIGCGEMTYIRDVQA